MTVDAIAVQQNSAEREQYFILPGCYTWQQFKALKTSLGENTKVKITYLDGKIVKTDTETRRRGDAEKFYYA